VKSGCKTMSVTVESLRIFVSIIWRMLDKIVYKCITIIQKMPKIIIEKEMLKINMQKIRLVFITYNINNIGQIYSHSCYT